MAEGIKKISENVTVANRALVITNPSVTDNDAISIGALQSNPTDRGLKLKTSKGVYSYFNAINLIEPYSIKNILLADKCITKPKMDVNSVGTDQLEANAVTEVKIKNDSVTRNKIKNGEIVQGKLSIDAVINANLTKNCVTNVKIQDNTIENSKLFDHTITNAKIALGTINANCLSKDAVTNAKILDNTIENSKYKNYSIYGNKIANGAIKNVHLDANCVNKVNILNGSVDGNKIAPNSINEHHIADEQITMRCIYPFSVTEGKIHDDAVTTNKIRNKNVNISKLADDVLNLIGDPVKYDSNNDVLLRRHLNVSGNIFANGDIKATRIYNSVFMDLAEAYTPAPEETLVPGDIVELREDGYLYKANSIKGDKTIVGVISDEYAQCFGADTEELLSGEKVAVGMIGKVHVNVVGPVKIGDRIGACKNGVGVSKNIDLSLSDDYIIGKALESNDSHEPKKVLCLIFPN